MEPVRLTRFSFPTGVGTVHQIRCPFPREGDAQTWDLEEFYKATRPCEDCKIEIDRAFNSGAGS